MTNNLQHLTQLLDRAFKDKPNNQALVGLDSVINYNQLYLEYQKDIQNKPKMKD